MKKTLLIAAGVLVALPAYAQSSGSSTTTTTTTRESPAGTTGSTTRTTTSITTEQRGRIERYVQRERVPSVTLQEQVSVGSTLPGSVQLRTFPSDVGVEEYRYTIVNGRTYLVDPSSRRIVQIIE